MRTFNKYYNLKLAKKGNIMFETEIPEQKKRINSKKKGNNAELKICKILTEHFHKPFNRVPSSGAFGLTHSLENNAANIMAGDIICPENFKYIIECKCGYNIDFINLISSEINHDKRLFDSFLEQAERDAKRVNKKPMVIYMKDRREPMVCSDVYYDDINYMKYKDYTILPLSNILMMKDEKFYE